MADFFATGFLAGGAGAAGAAGGRAATVRPGFSDICPSVTTVSPAFSPLWITAVVSWVVATVIGRRLTLLSAPTT